MNKISEGIAWANENLYQPRLQPLVNSFIGNVYQPHISPLVDKGAGQLAEKSSWINRNIYKPFIQPVVADIDQYIYQPYFKPVYDKVTDWWGKTWDEYGEWVHGALDTVGFIPGLGDIADGINGLIYLGEGRYLEASISALSIIPLIGDLSKGGKWAAKFGGEIVEEAVEKVIKEGAEEILEEITEITVREVGEELIEKVTKETVEETVEKTLRESGEDIFEKTIREVGDEIGEKALREVSEDVIGKTTKNTIREVSEKNILEIGEGTFEKSTKNISEKTIQGITEQFTEKVVNKTSQEIKLVAKHGPKATKLVDVVGTKPAKKLLDTLDDDVIDYVIEQGPEAIDALSKWSGKELREHGPELALRATKDADVLRDVKKLVSAGPIDPAHLTNEQKDLIRAIAKNSTQYADNGQTVLGKWVDYGNGFSDYARRTGSAHYNPHPDMWNLLGELGEQNRDNVAWLVNEQVLQTGISKSLPFEYSLNGISKQARINEITAIQKLFSGATDIQIMKALGTDYVPVRFKELQMMREAGYEFLFDKANKSYILSLP